jgi:diguanylate cyclase (GGDEF)-like protein/PAS domain S-box-containing protein
MAVVLIVISNYNYLLFHTLAELFAIGVAVLLSVVAWNTHDLSRNHYLAFLGSGYLVIAALDLMHTLVYKGMSVIPVLGANPATQYWIATRYMEALLLLLAPLFLLRPVNRRAALSVFSVAGVTVVALITTGNFPDAFIEGEGLTRFKINSEYVIVVLLATAGVFLWWQREKMDRAMHIMMMSSIALTIIAELAFTFYVSVYGLSNLVGHIFKFFSFWLIFVAVVRTSLKKPFSILSDDLRRRENELSAILKNIPQIVYAQEADSRRFVFVNGAFEALTGVEGRRLVGRTADSVFSPSQCAALVQDDDETLAPKGKRGAQQVPFDTPGGRRILQIRRLPVADAQDRLAYLLNVAEDVTERLAEKAELLESNRRYASMLETTRDGFWVTDAEGRILEVNDTYCRLSGFTREELLQKTATDVDVVESLDATKDHIALVMERGSDIFETQHLRKDGSVWSVEVSATYLASRGGRFYAFLRDITDRKHNEVVLDLRGRLSDLVYQSDQDRIMREALDTAERASHSGIGFFHLVQDDQQQILLQVWSTRTMKGMCQAEAHGMHYPLPRAGVWADCIRERRALIHNDYAALPHKKGMPDGHAPVMRELVVPLFRSGRVVAVMGVGNKPHDYTAMDVDLVRRIADVAYDCVERKRVEQHIEYMAYHDVLTGLPNRELLADRLSQAIKQSNRSGQPFAVCYLDLDGFKPVNDTYGHQTGDALLLQLAQRLSEVLREADTLARMGGDEFVLLLNGLSSLPDAEQIIHRILQGIREPFDVEGYRILVSGSIGATIYPMDDADSDTLLRHADQAMYAAKGGEKGAFRLFQPVLDYKAHEHHQALENFARALAHGELVLHYQPRVDLASGEVTSVEALVRWENPERGLLGPAEFLPLIEGSPYEIALGEWVVGEALRQYSRWRAEGSPLPVSVNISPRHIQMEGFAEFLGRQLADYPPGTAQDLELEILETSAIGDTARVASTMNECAKLGVKFALDDFGTGYASLSYFHQLPINTLKIDRGFVRRMLQDDRDLQIVKGVLWLSNALNRPVVAEGVESIEIGFVLLQLGCRFAQGYGIARPMPAAKVTPWRRDWDARNVWGKPTDPSALSSRAFDLDVAVFQHQRWLNQMTGGIDAGDAEALNGLPPERCQFSTWYEGVGRDRFGEQPDYALVGARHQQVHDLAARLASAVQADDGQAAQGLRAELEQAHGEFVDLLGELGNAGANHAEG